MELLVYPAIYEIWKWNFELKPELKRAGVLAKVPEPAPQGLAA
jgi:hypothetical protein